MFSLICVWINSWVNNREAGDLERHRGHYDINVMSQRNLVENMHTIVVIIVPADGLAPSGARSSAGTVMTKSRSQT